MFFKKHHPPAAQPKTDGGQYARDLVRQLNALEAKQRTCNLRDPSGRQSHNLLQHQKNQVLHEAHTNGLLFTFDDRTKQWQLFA